MLLDAGADINSIYQTSENIVLTPLDCSLTRSFRSTAKFLQFHGGLPASKLRISSQSSKMTDLEKNTKSLTMSSKPKMERKESKKCSSSKKVVIYVDGSNSDTDECKDANVRVHNFNKMMDKTEQKRRKRKQHTLNRRYRTKSFNIYLRRNSSSDESNDKHGNTEETTTANQSTSERKDEPCKLVVVKGDSNEPGIASTEKDDILVKDTEQMIQQISQKQTTTQEMIKNEESSKTNADDKNISTQFTENVTQDIDKVKNAAKSDQVNKSNIDNETKADVHLEILTEVDSNPKENINATILPDTQENKDVDTKPTNKDDLDNVQKPEDERNANEIQANNKQQDNDEIVKIHVDSHKSQCLKEDKIDLNKIEDNLDNTNVTMSTDDIVDKGESVPQISIDVSNTASKDNTTKNINPVENKLTENISENEEIHISQPIDDTAQRKTSFTVLDSMDDVDVEPSFEVIQHKISECHQASHDRASSADDEDTLTIQEQHDIEFQKHGAIRSGSKPLTQITNTNSFNEQQLLCSKDLDSGIEPSPRANLSSPQSTSSLDKSKRVLQKRWTGNTHRKECKQASQKSEINMSTVALSLQEDINRYDL